MIVRAEVGDGRVTLLDAGDFQRFHVEVIGEARDLAPVLRPYGDLDGDHAWLRLDAVEALAGEVDDAWREGFAAMVDYARREGFLSADGTAIRAHLEIT